MLQNSLARDRKALMAEQYRREARTDAMTGLYNKAAFLEKEVSLTDKLWNARRNQETDYSFVIMSIDLNNLKKVNDSIGHAKGDIFIKDAANLLKNSVDKKGEVYRVGGDEFMALIFGDNPEKEYQQIIELLKKKADEYNKKNTMGVPLSFAYGHAMCSSSDNESIYDIEKEADKEMYNCKSIMKQNL